MNYLFLDTTTNLKIGLLDSNFKWKKLLNLETKKPSEVIHKYIYDLLQEFQLKIKDINTVITCAGPGSYTGMRLSEGIVQILEFEGVNVTSFYHFELPSFNESNKEYLFATTAFKGEYYLYHYINGKIDKKLILKDELKSFLNDHYKNITQKFTLNADELLTNFDSTSSLIVDKPEIYFPKIKDRNLKQAAYYFRTIEEEFKPQ